MMKLVFFGTPDFVIPIAQSLTDHFDLVGVVTSPDIPQGRKKILTPSPVKTWYMDYLLKNNKEGVILTPDELTEDIAIRLRKLHPDLFITAAYGKLIPQNILEIPLKGSFNIHPSHLPEYRGPSPIQQAILDGKESLGISIMEMDEELDHGPILTQWDIPIEMTDTFASLHIKAFEEVTTKLPQIVTAYVAGILRPIPQNHSMATFCGKVTKQNGYFDIAKPPDPTTLNRMIRAYYPWPTAWTHVRIKKNESRIMKFLPEGKVQMEGGKVMSIKDFLNGYPELKHAIENLHLS